MNLLFICESFPTSSKADFTGGVEARDYYTALQLSNNHQVTVITNARISAASSQNLGKIKVLRCGQAVEHHRRENPLVRLNFIFSAIKMGYKLDFDIIQGSNVVSQVVAGILGVVKRRPKIALVADVFVGNWISNTNFITGLTGEIIERLVFILPWNHYIAVSHTTKQKLINQHVNENKISVIHAGVDHKLCDSIKVAKYKTPTITYAGRLVDYKRVQDLIVATKTLLKSKITINLKIIGTGPKLSELEQLSRKLKISDYIDFLGFVDNYKEVLTTIKKSHIFCSPSVVEGFGLTTLEAMSCGTPAVLSDIPTVAEVTSQGQGVVLFSPRNSNSLALSLRSLLTNNKLYKTKVKQAKKHVAAYNWNITAQQVESVFTDVL